jgi:hypothetical protein
VFSTHITDGELRQPGPEIMQKLSGAKEKLGLRVHGLIIGSPEKKRADPAVLRALCTNYLPNGKVELCMSEFEGWASVQVRVITCYITCLFMSSVGFSSGAPVTQWQGGDVHERV